MPQEALESLPPPGPLLTASWRSTPFEGALVLVRQESGAT
jgi:hypothetical protein